MTGGIYSQSNLLFSPQYEEKPFYEVVRALRKMTRQTGQWTPLALATFHPTVGGGRSLLLAAGPAFETFDLSFRKGDRLLRRLAVGPVPPDEVSIPAIADDALRFTRDTVHLVTDGLHEAIVKPAKLMEKALRELIAGRATVTEVGEVFALPAKRK